jgi:MFS family permease
MTTDPPASGPDAHQDSASRGPRHAAWALVLICTAQLMVVLDSTIANIALPKIQASLDIDFANLSWVVTGYALAFGGLLLLGGRLGDLYGRRRVFMIGVTLFALASAVGGIAQNEAMLLGSRGMQGLAAALASPSALALITTTFPPGPQRNRAFSVFAAMSGIGAAIGLVLGGWLTNLDPEWGWRLTFLINVPIGLAAAFLAPRLLPDSEHHDGWLDVPGAITGTVGLLTLVFGITRTGNTDPDTVSAANPMGTPYGWGDPVALTFLFAKGVFEHYVGMQAEGISQATVDAMIDGSRFDHLGLGWKVQGMIWSGNVGVVLLWVAAVLTAVSGYDYFRKAWPYLKDKPHA